MFDEFLKKADELVMLGETFATATVVRYEAPISGKPGDKAIIFADGEVWGWIGGGFARCRQHFEASTFARRNSVHRRDNAGGVSQVDREGSIAGTALPGCQSTAAERGGRDPHHHGHQGSL